MRVAVIDVGSNTARLLVANVTPEGRVFPVVEDRAFLRLGAEIEQTGTIGAAKIVQAAETCAGFARTAAENDVERAGVIVTAPGRQGAAGVRLASSIERATLLPVRVLSGEGEARLAYDGAVHGTTAPLPEVVGVVDVGGGSTEIAVGTPLLGAAWIASADLGSLRLTRATLPDDPPTSNQVAAARSAVAKALAAHEPPHPDLALAVGGSARAIARIVGRTFDADDLERVVKLLRRRASAKAVRSFGIGPERAQTLLAGALLLGGASRVLGVPLELGRGGVREGAALELAGVEHEVERAA